MTWLTLDEPWLCRSWTGDASRVAASGIPDGTIEASYSSPENTGYSSGDAVVHCTRLWHVDSQGRLISGAPAWVPNPTGAWPTGPYDYLPDASLLTVDRRAPTPTPKAHLTHRNVQRSKQPTPRPAPPPPAPPGGYNPWAPVPGHPSYGMVDFAGDPWHAYFGACTWYAWYRHQSEPLLNLGNAAAWPGNAPRYGLRVGTTPVVGATVIFQPGVEGAASGGHAAHVEQVLGGGWFIISEMNFSWNGGGWGRVDWRYVYMAPGVSFIY